MDWWIEVREAMDDELSTPVSLLGRFGPWGPVESGELTLANGVVTFAICGNGTAPPIEVFSVPIDQVSARFPWHYLGLGMQLTVAGTCYRFWFVALRWAVGHTTGPAGGKITITIGNQFYLNEVGPARFAVRKWRAALTRILP